MILKPEHFTVHMDVANIVYVSMLVNASKVLISMAKETLKQKIKSIYSIY